MRNGLTVYLRALSPSPRTLALTPALSNRMGEGEVVPAQQEKVALGLATLLRPGTGAVRGNGTIKMRPLSIYKKPSVTQSQRRWVAGWVPVGFCGVR